MASSSARLAVILVALLFSTGGAAVKLASLNAWQIAGLRSLVAFLVLAALVPGVRQRPTWRSLVLAVPYAGVMVLFVHANTMASAASVTLLQATAPLYVLLLSRRWLGERAPMKVWFLLPLFAIGMFVLLGEQSAATPIAAAPTVGRWLAAGAGLCFGLCILGLSAIQAGDKATGGKAMAMQGVAYGNLLAAAVALPFAAAQWSPMSGVDLGVVVYLGGVQIGLAYAILLPAMRTLAAVEVSLLLLVELVASPVFAAVIHGESLGLRTGVGGLVILSACIIYGLSSDRGPLTHAGSDFAGKPK